MVHIGIYRGTRVWGLRCKNQGLGFRLVLLRVPQIRIRLYWGLHWALPPLYANYQAFKVEAGCKLRA